jgi:hypothetical protein
MTKHPTAEDLGPPELEVVGFQLWVHGRQFPDSISRQRRAIAAAYPVRADEARDGV